MYVFVESFFLVLLSFACVFCSIRDCIYVVVVGPVEKGGVGHCEGEIFVLKLIDADDLMRLNILYTRDT